MPHSRSFRQLRRWSCVVSVMAAMVFAGLAPASAATRPSAPRSPSATSLNEAVKLTWLAPSTTGGAAITDYVVLYRRANTTIWSQFLDGTSTARTTTVTGLANGRGYQFKVAARNRSGQSAFSTVVTGTPSAKPGAPRNLSAFPLPDATGLVWDAPLNDGGTAISDYLIQYKPVSASTWTTHPDGVSTATQSSVPVGGGHQFRVAARNLAGKGPFVTVTRQPDADGDGYPAGDDCNDSDPAINPGAGDVGGDGIDQNCDGTDGVDADGDTHPAGPDCNDNDPAVHPGAVELRNDAVDNDCDGFIDEADVDGDDDGFPEGPDCNDSDPAINPAAPEVAGDGIDNDCDGTVDEAA